MSVSSINFQKDVHIQKLDKTSFDLNRFKCSKQQYENYIKKEAFDDQDEEIGQTWLFVYKKKEVIGYVTIAMADLNKNDHKKLESFPHSNVPGLLIGQIATHKDFEGLGVGKTMIDWVVTEAKNYQNNIGCRVVVLSPENDVISWYKKIGFVHIQHKRKQDVMFIDLDWYS